MIERERGKSHSVRQKKRLCGCISKKDEEYGQGGKIYIYTYIYIYVYI